MQKLLLKILTVLAVGIVALPAAAWATDAAAKAEIKFKGSSTLHEFEGTATSKPFDAVFQEDAETGQLKVTAKTSIAVQDMTTDNKKRDKNMFKMFDLVHFKNIDGEITDASLSEKKSSKAKLHLKIRNVERDVVATVSNVQRTGPQVSCTMTFPVSLSGFGLKAPSVMGVIRVDDTVYVECSISGKVVDKVTER